ncbi:MAG TPA: hypothetical protein VF853_02735 [Candidatus Deferrimicrobiaceae bacterium]
METAPRRIGLATLYALCLAPAPGKVAGILGPGACRLALRALARPLLSGEPVVAVDGGNRFDPYEVARAERALGGTGRDALSRLLVSRAFTCHQLEALLARRLPAALSRSRARVALVLALPETFADEDVPYAEACRVFQRCLAALRRLSREGARVVVTGESGGGHSSPSAPEKTKTEECPPKRSGFFRYLARTSDPLLVLAGDTMAGDTLPSLPGG